MPRSKQKHKSAHDGCTVPFTGLISVSAVANVASIYGLSPSSLSLSRISSAADSWTLFRVRKLRFRIHPNTSANYTAVICYFPGQTDNPPTSVIDASQMLSHAVSTADHSMPSAWVHVPASDLAGPMPWYKSIFGTVDETEEQPGSVMVVSNVTTTLVCEVAGTYEFKGAVSITNTPQITALEAQIRVLRKKAVADLERRKALAVISGTTGK